VGTIAALTVLSRVVGFLRTAVLAGVAGRSCVADAYLTANQLPNVVFEVVAGGALAATVVPLLAGAAADLVGTLSALLGWVLLLLVPVAVGCAAAAPLIAHALSGAGCAGEAGLVARMVVVFAPQIPLYGLAVLAAGALQARSRFAAAAAAPLVSSIVVTSSYLLFRSMSRPTSGTAAALPGPALAVLAGGTTAGVVALTVTVVAAGRRVPELRAVRPTLAFPPGRRRLAGRLAGAGLVAVLAAQAAAVVVTVVANRHGVPGSLATYAYATAVSLLPAAVLTTPVTTTVLSRVSRAGQPGAAGRLVTRSTAAVVLLGMLGSAALVAAAPGLGQLLDAAPGVRGLAGRAGGGPAMVAVLDWLAVGVPGAALSTHLARLAGGLGRTRAAGLLGSVGWVATGLGVGAASLLTPPARIAAALGAATGLGMLAGAAVAVAAWSGRWGADALRPVLAPAALGVLAAAAGAVAGRAVGGRLLEPGAGPATAVLAAGTGALVAVGVAAALFTTGAALAGPVARRPWRSRHTERPRPASAVGRPVPADRGGVGASDTGDRPGETTP